MTAFLTILASASGIIGVGLGIVLNEFMRRKNRKEMYAPTIFSKRLAAYESLLELINEGSEIAYEVIENPDLTSEQRHDLSVRPETL